MSNDVFFSGNKFKLMTCAAEEILEVTSQSSINSLTTTYENNNYKYTFTWDIQDTDNKDANDSNTAQLIKVQINGSAESLTIGTVKVKYRPSGSTSPKTYTLRITEIGNGVQSLMKRSNTFIPTTKRTSKRSKRLQSTPERRHNNHEEKNIVYTIQHILSYMLIESI